MSTKLILGFVFFCLSCSVMVIRKTYFEVPLSELKKREALGDDVPEHLTKTLSYGAALRVLLWAVLTISLAVSTSLLALALPLWVSIIVLSIVIYFIFSYLPKTKVSRADKLLTKLVSPALNWLLKHSSKYLSLVYKPLANRYSAGVPPVYDNQDLLGLLKRLDRDSSTRIEPDIILSLERSLSFNDRIINDLMTPSKKIKKLLESDVIGPVLINELHESQEDYALVRDEPKGDITGVLALSDLTIRSQGRVGAHMHREVCFVSQTDPILSVIKAFYDTKSPIFVVRGDNQKFVGLISLEVVVKQLTGSLSTAFIEDKPEIAKTDN